MTEARYHCPRTGRPLVRRGDAFETPDGTMSYPVTRGIPDFRLTPPPDPADEQEIQQMVELAERDGWRSAVGQIRPEMLGYVDDATRAMFLDLIPLNKDMRALEIGCGLGQILVALASRVRELHAIELSPGQAQFAAERCRQEGFDNVHVAAGGDDLLLPFADQTFEAVVMNHVFEWIRIADDVSANLAAQRLVLGEIKRVLAPGGVLYISTKNRYGLRLLLGGRDENVRDIRFGSALPRRVANQLAAGKPGVLGLLHSYPTFERLLREAGFETLGSYWGAPDGRYPQRYVATDPAAIRAARKARGFKQGPTRSTRLLMPLVPARLVKYVAPGLTFVARSTARASAQPIAAE
jgi:SAM-dependent methyltransferase